MTKKELLNAIIDGTIEQDDLVEFARNEIEKLGTENEPLLAEMYGRFTNGEILTSDDFSDMELTTQKIVALLATLVREGLIIKVPKVKVDKRKLRGYKLSERE